MLININAIKTFQNQKPAVNLCVDYTEQIRPSSKVIQSHQFDTED